MFAPYFLFNYYEGERNAESTLLYSLFNKV